MNNDLSTLICLIFVLQIVIAIFSFVYGNPLRIINGYDSFGNTCGVKYNEKFQGFPLSGMNTLDKPELFYFDVKELKKSLKICVKSCPAKTMTKGSELLEYYSQTGTQLCKYDYNMQQLTTAGNDAKTFNFLGPCPSFPVHERCVLITSPKSNAKLIHNLITSFQFACPTSLCAQGYGREGSELLRHAQQLGCGPAVRWRHLLHLAHHCHGLWISFA